MRIKILKTNRRVPASCYLTACKEQDGLLGNIEMNHYTDVGDITEDDLYYLSVGENVKRAKQKGDIQFWTTAANELSKPGVFDKLARLLGGKR
jgi:hypothetical protein